MQVTTKTRIIIGASAYASISYTHTNGDEHHIGTIDFKLPGGRGAPADLLRIALDHRARAARELRMADIAEHAAVELTAAKLA
jgi:hypothetical protein